MQVESSLLLKETNKLVKFVNFCIYYMFLNILSILIENSFDRRYDFKYIFKNFINILLNILIISIYILKLLNLIYYWKVP